MDVMAKAKTVDPDDFNPFSAIPFSNNPELKYVFANVDMRKYINEHDINVKDYQWKNYHDSFDHGSSQYTGSPRRRVRSASGDNALGRRRRRRWRRRTVGSAGVNVEISGQWQ